ncbi:MAG: glycosyltransferase, partial [Bacteroidota bacterium]
MKLSLVITVYNEEDNIAPMIEQVAKALDGWDYELIFVDDGSSDRTRSNIEQHANEHVKMVVLNKNYGQTTAMAAGIDHATGEYIVTLDGDLQNDPADIPAMVKKLEAEDM